MKFSLIFIVFCFADVTFSRTLPTDSSYVIMVQPIVVQSDNGADPASMALPEDLVDRAYSRANIDFVFFEPIYFNNTLARDGEINLDQIVREADEQNLIRGNGDIVNMFFVNKVDKNPGPLGRGLLNGAVTFIALGEGNSEDQREMEAFVIAHEVGHNLGLNHAVDDPNVPDTIPNIQGGGSYKNRIDPQYSLNDYQIDQVHKSTLVTKKIDFQSIERGRVGILDESFEPYFSLLQEREIFVFTKEWPKTEKIEDARTFAREKFQSAVIEFSSKEMECLQFVIHNIDSILDKQNIDLFQSHPWRFIKIDDWLCGGFAHTRGTYTILSERYLKRYTDKFGPNMTAKDSAFIVTNLGALLIHEQLHSLQRTRPTLFRDLYTNYWTFEEVVITQDRNELVVNQLLNPDAPDADWIYNDGARKYWIRVLINEKAENPLMGKDFTSKTYEIKYEAGKYSIRLGKNGVPKVVRKRKQEAYLNSFPISNGADHPNEISAYMYAQYFKALSLREQPFSAIEKSTRLNTELFINWLSQTKLGVISK